MNPIDELAKKLQENDIPFERGYSITPRIEQICYPVNGRERVCSIIFGQGTYGYEYGKLEIMGLLTPDEEEYDSVRGYLTADEVFERIKNHYESCNK